MKMKSFALYQRTLPIMLTVILSTQLFVSTFNTNALSSPLLNSVLPGGNAENSILSNIKLSNINKLLDVTEIELGSSSLANDKYVSVIQTVETRVDELNLIFDTCGLEEKKYLYKIVSPKIVKITTKLSNVSDNLNNYNDRKTFIKKFIIIIDKFSKHASGQNPLDKLITILSQKIIQDSGTQNLTGTTDLKADPTANELSKAYGSQAISDKGENLSVSFTEKDFNDFSQKADETSSLLSDLKSSYKEASLINSLASSLQINASLPESNSSSTDTLKRSTITINKNVIGLINEKKLNELVFNSAVASISLNKNDLLSGKDKLSVTAFKLNNSNLPTELTSKFDLKNSSIFDLSVLSDSLPLKKLKNNSTIKLPYKLKDGESKKNITVFYIGDDGKKVNMSGLYNSDEASISFNTNHFSIYFVKANDVNFEDVNDSSWAKDLIDSMASKGIINGMPSGSFEPNSPITRAQFVTMLINVLKLNFSEKNSIFNDVPENEWYKIFVMTAFDSGIVVGEKDKFRPNDNMSRQEIAAVVTKTLEKCLEWDIPDYASINLNEIYADGDSVNSYAKKSVYVVNKMEIMGGRENQMFMPTSPITRAEASAVMYKLLLKASKIYE